MQFPDRKSQQEVVRVLRTYVEVVAASAGDPFARWDIDPTTSLSGHRHRDAVAWTVAREHYEARPWRGQRDHSGGGALINQAIHTIDLLQWFLGDVTAVGGRAGTYLLGDVIDVEDSAQLAKAVAAGRDPRGDPDRDRRRLRDGVHDRRGRRVRGRAPACASSRTGRPRASRCGRS